MLGKLVRWVRRNRNKLLAALSFAAAGYFLYKCTEE